MLSWCLVVPASAQEIRPIKELEEVGITENLENQVPLDLKFRDSFGTEVTLGDYFNNGKATILTLNYADCPNLCNQQLSALAKTIKELKMTPGQEYQILTVSIDPIEKPMAAANVRQLYLKFLDREDADWTFLIGKQEPITTLAKTVGFGYNFLPEKNEFAHTAALILLTPEGKVARYLYGIEYIPQTLRLSLLETAKGEVRSTMDRLILYCFQYDATAGGYTLAVLRLTRIAGAVTLVLLGTFILRQMRRNRKIEQSAA
jgi:protein SCO1